MKAVPLSQVCKLVNGGTPKSGVAEYWGGDVAWLTPAEMGKRSTPYISETARNISRTGLANCSAKQVPVGAVIMSTRAPIGHLAIPETPMAFNQGCRGLIPNDTLDTKYLYYFLWFSRDALNELGTGATFKELSSGALGNYSIPLPPIEEQRRIVAVLDEAFAAIATATANAEKNLANARELFACTVEEMLGRVADCQTMTLLAAADESCSLSYGIVQPGDEVPGGLAIVRPTDLQQKFIELGPLKRIAPKLASAYQRTTLQGDELLLCVRGTTGTLSIATPELAGGNVTRGIVPIRFNRAILSQKLGYYLLLSASVQKQIKAATYGAALMQINIRDLKQLELRVPPDAIQVALTDRLDAVQSYVEQLQANYSDKLEALAALKQSILDRAFTGDLTASTPDLAIA